jgi:hypothetical protein
MINCSRFESGSCRLFSKPWGRFSADCNAAVKDQINAFLNAGKALFQRDERPAGKSVSDLKNTAARADIESETACSDS